LRLQDCIQNKFSPDKVFGGDTLFHHCILFKGIAPMDPGHYTWDQGFNGFDPGGQLVGGSAPWHGVGAPPCMRGTSCCCDLLGPA